MSKRILDSILIALAFAALTGCGVKPKNPAASTPQATATNLPAGVFVGEKGKMLVGASALNFTAGEENTLTFRLVTVALSPVNLAEHTVRIKYDMPTMPQMGIFDAVVKPAGGSGEITATFDIVHGGVWEVRLELYRGETLVDKLAYRWDVPNT